MFCSTIIPTIGRPTLSKAVYSVLEQSFAADNFEVIVVNDTGRPLPEAGWQTSNKVQVITTNQRERSVARNTGAAIARGKYLHFLDDDDWLLPGALEHFWALSRQVGDAVWLYGGTQIVGTVGECFGELNLGKSGNCFAQVMGGAFIPIQASLIKPEAFFAIGGYQPLLFATQDVDLCRRLALYGSFINTSATVACLLRGETWSSVTDYDRAPEYHRLGRDKILSKSNAFMQLQHSADTAYWHGRIFRVYLSGILLNLKRKWLFTAASRTFFTIAGLILAGRHLFSPDFWHAVRVTQVPCTIQEVMMNAARSKERKEN